MAMWDNIPYVSIRFSLWAILWCLSVLDFIVHKGEKVHGWQLHRCLFVVLTFVLAKEAAILTWSVTTGGGDTFNPVFYVLLILWNLADASFQCLLMAISYGWQITRDTISGGGWAIAVAPALYFVATTTHNYIWIKNRGIDSISDVTELDHVVLLIATLVYMMTMIFMWQWIFQSTQAVKDRLEEQLANHQKEDSPDLDDRARMGQSSAVDITSSAQDGSVMAATDDNVMDGSDVDEEGDSHQHAENGGEEDGGWRAPVHMDLDLDLEDQDNTAVSMTVNAKLQLMRRFWWAVTGYFVASLLLMVVSIFNADENSHLELIHNIVVIGHNLIYFLFIAGLCFIFRLREANPYFLLGGNYDTSVWGDDEKGLEDQLEMN